MTGLKESKAKGRDLGPSVVASPGIAKPVFPVTGGSRREPLRAADAAAKIFETSLKPAPGVASGHASTGASESASVGSALWEEDARNSKSSLELGIDGKGPGTGAEITALAAGGPSPVEAGIIPGSAGISPEQSAGLRGGNSFNARETASVDASGAGARASFAVASAESDLFVLVHDRYRASELFRKARVSDVPLGAFDPKK